MNNAHGFTVENILASFPPALDQDRKMHALAETICRELVEERGLADEARIYANIDELPEELLDILARDFKVDWWDANYTLEEKRATLKDSWRVHRILGTPAAVLTAISDIYPDTQLFEWWTYGGQPYHFKLVIDATFQKVDPEKHARVLERVNYYKNLRSILDDIEYYDTGTEAVEHAYAAYLGCEITDGATAVRS